jgi:hypothetical protein
LLVYFFEPLVRKDYQTFPEVIFNTVKIPITTHKQWTGKGQYSLSTYIKMRIIFNEELQGLLTDTAQVQHLPRGSDGGGRERERERERKKIHRSLRYKPHNSQMQNQNDIYYYMTCYYNPKQKNRRINYGNCTEQYGMALHAKLI